MRSPALTVSLSIVQRSWTKAPPSLGTFCRIGVGQYGWMEVIPPTSAPLTWRTSGSVQPSDRSVIDCGTGMPMPTPLLASVLTTRL